MPDVKPYSPKEIEDLRAFLERRRVASPTMQRFYTNTGQDPSIEAFGRLLATLDLQRGPCPECKGRGWHVGDCHPRESCGVCSGTGVAPMAVFQASAP